MGIRQTLQVTGLVISSRANWVKAKVLGRLYEKRQALPWGVDSRPARGVVCVFSETSRMGDEVILGCVHEEPNALAAEGELRLYAEQGGMYVWVKNDGDLLLGGEAYHLARYEQLETAFNELKEKFNDLVAAFNSHTHASAPTGPITPPSPLPPGEEGAPPTPWSLPIANSEADITPAKAEKLKTL